MRKRIVIMIMGIALMALPIMAQQQEWKSTSAMQTSGSVYTPQVTAVGATAVTDNATTTESNSPAKAPGGPRKIGTPSDGLGQAEGFPIGDAVFPLLLMSLAFGMFVYFRRKQTLNG